MGKADDYVLIYAVQEHRANHEIMSESVKQNEYTPVYAEPEHKTDRESLLDLKPDYVTK